VLSGDDALTLPMMASARRGVISVTSNVLPGEVQAVCAAFLKGDLETARARHLELLPVHDAMFVETNPGPVKALLAAQGRLAPEVRLPLAWPSEANVAKSQEALSRYLARTVTR
jgi:4-hydroxy-tetrahydrodipicolinate synthase